MSSKASPVNGCFFMNTSGCYGNTHRHMQGGGGGDGGGGVDAGGSCRDHSIFDTHEV